MALPKQNRLGSSREFNRVHRRGVRVATDHLAVRALNLKSKVQPVPKPVIKSAMTSATEPAAKAAGPALQNDIMCSPGDASVPPISSRTVAPPTQRRKEVRSADDPSRAVSSFGISISRKVSKRAVVRNRIKRQIKAVIRQYLPNIAPGWQVVIVVRPAAVEFEFDDFLRELEKIFRKLKILNLK